MAPGRAGSIGVVHGVVQLAVAFGVVARRGAGRGRHVVRRSMRRFPRDPSPASALVVVPAPSSAPSCSRCTSASPDSQGPFGINSNELFAGMAIEDHKCFLRLHLDHVSGDLTVYPIKVDHVPSWRFNRASGGRSRSHPKRRGSCPAGHRATS